MVHLLACWVSHVILALIENSHIDIVSVSLDRRTNFVFEISITKWHIKIDAVVWDDVQKSSFALSHNKAQNYLQCTHSGNTLLSTGKVSFIVSEIGLDNRTSEECRAASCTFTLLCVYLYIGITSVNILAEPTRSTTCYKVRCFADIICSLPLFSIILFDQCLKCWHILIWCVGQLCYKINKY